MTNTEKLAQLQEQVAKVTAKVENEKLIKAHSAKIQKYVEGLKINWEQFIRLAHAELPKQERILYSDDEKAKWVKMAAGGKKAKDIADTLYAGKAKQTIAGHLKKQLEKAA